MPDARMVSRSLEQLGRLISTQKGLCAAVSARLYICISREISAFVLVFDSPDPVAWCFM